jgi:hypothetical protein
MLHKESPRQSTGQPRKSARSMHFAVDLSTEGPRALRPVTVRRCPCARRDSVAPSLRKAEGTTGISRPARTEHRKRQLAGLSCGEGSTSTAFAMILVLREYFCRVVAFAPCGSMLHKESPRQSTGQPRKSARSMHFAVDLSTEGPRRLRPVTVRRCPCARRDSVAPSLRNAEGTTGISRPTQTEHRKRQLAGLSCGEGSTPTAFAMILVLGEFVCRVVAFAPSGSMLHKESTSINRTAARAVALAAVKDSRLDGQAGVVPACSRAPDIPAQ